MTTPTPGRAGPFRERLYAAAVEQAAAEQAPPLPTAGEHPGGEIGPAAAPGPETPHPTTRWITAHGLLVLQAHPALPQAVRSGLAAAARRNLAHNLLLIDRFQAAVEALAPLPVCPLKGIHLLDTIYAADPQHRVMADLDLLVRPEDGKEAVRRLGTLGYAEPAASRRAAPHWHERVLGDGRVTVELHTRLGVKHGRHTTWQEVAPVPATVHGRPVHRLDDATTLVHLVTHFVKHGPFVRLGWAEDVLRWVEETGLDGHGALRVARRLGAARSFLAGVRALAAVAGEDFLPAVPRRSPGWEGTVVAGHERWLWPSLADAHTPLEALACGTASTPWRRNLSALLLADRPADALAYLAAKGRELVSRRPRESHRRRAGPAP